MNITVFTREFFLLIGSRCHVVCVMWLQSMRQPLEDPAVLANRPAEKQEEKAERDSRNLVKRLLTFGLTEQVPVLSCPVIVSSFL